MTSRREYCPIASAVDVLGDRWTPLILRELMACPQCHAPVGAYELTAAGEGLTPIVWAMGHWAAEWVFGDPTDEDCDGLSLIWRTHQLAVPAKLPQTRTVVHLLLTGSGGAEGWLDIKRPGITVCREDQGLAIDLALEADTAQMQRWLLGLVPFRELVANGHARFLGPSRLAQRFPTWFDTTTYSRSLRLGEQRRLRESVPA